MNKYFIQINGRTVGPMTATQVMAYSVYEDTPVCADSGTWAPLYTFPELQELLADKRRHVGTAMHRPGDKEKTVAGILAILLGGLGVQYFYLGKVSAGIITILLSMVTCGIWPVLMLIQGILMLTMSEEEFRAKFVDSTKTLPLF